MATYTKRGSRYRVRWRNPGDKNPRSYSVPDEQTAREFTAEASRSESRREPWVPPPERIAPVAQRSLETLAVAWLEEVKRTARPSTVSAYADSVGRFVEFSAGQLGRVPVLTDLTPDLVRGFDGEQLDRGLTVHTRRARYAAIASWAGWLEAEHPDVFRAAPVRAVKMPRAPKAKVLALTWREVDAIVQTLGGAGHVAATASTVEHRLFVGTDLVLASLPPWERAQCPSPSPEPPCKASMRSRSRSRSTCSAACPRSASSAWRRRR